MSKKKKLNENINSLSGLLGGIVTNKPINSPLKSELPKSSKLTSIVEDMYGKQKSDLNFDVKEFVQTVGNYNSFSKIINREGNLRDVANTLAELAESAKSHTLSETEDWFDKVTVTRNMKELGSLSQQFKKTAVEAQSLQERMTGLYEDMGNILGRYYNINEDMVEGKYRTGDELEDDDSVKEGTYQDFFTSALQKFGVKSPEELDDNKKKQFYDYVDKNWSAKKETD